LNNAGFSGKPQNSPSTTGEDIPLALRDTPPETPLPEVVPKVYKRSPRLTVGGLIGFILIAILGGILFFVFAQKKNNTSQTSPNTPSTAAPTSQSDTSVNSNQNADTLLGHFSYPEAPASELVAVSADGRTRMRPAAARKFQEMAQAARRQGVILVPLSAFRSIKEQQQLFFGVSAQRNQSPVERAAVSAPPKYSEHHTGYAVDIGDGAVPATNVNPNFEKTKAFQWLQANAARFSFEMSFPKNNAQGVSYEPWHWRFVGDQDSLVTFYKARNIKPVKVGSGE
jgi:D-alanyl-D-alanine carboxypeptidase